MPLAHPSPWRRRLVSAIRWSLLGDAVVLAAAALLTVVPWPVWTQAMGTEAWPVGMVVPEIALWLVPLPVCFAAAALWLGRGRGRRWLTGVTLVLCAAGVVLLCKPAVQAWRLGRTLDATLAAAFGVPPVPPPCPAFSLAAAVVPRTPAPVDIETMQYADGLMLDFYRPPGAAGHSPRPCVVVIHGGSWVSGNRLDDGTKRWLNDWLAGLGYAVASIDYRLSPQFKWPAQRDDLLAAVGFLREHAAGLGIDADRLVLLGRSAGGQIATAVAYAQVIPGVRGIVNIYGPTDFDLTWDAATRPRSIDHRYNLEEFLGSRETARAAYQSASGAMLVTPRAPQTLILWGELDINVFPEQAELLERKLAAAGVPHALVSLPWAGHAFDFVNFNTPGAQIGRYAIVRFLASVTR